MGELPGARRAAGEPDPPAQSGVVDRTGLDQVRVRTPKPESQPSSPWTVNPVARSMADAATGMADALRLMLRNEPWTLMPAVGVDVTATRHRSFGAVAPIGLSWTVWTCQLSGRWFESRP